MSDKDKRLLFLTLLSLIVLVNLTLLWGLFSHFALRRALEVGEVNWLLGVFAGEFVGCAVVAWRKVINSAPPAEPAATPIVIERPARSEDEGDAGAALMEVGRRCLTEARDSRYCLKARRRYAQRAVELFSQVHKGHPAYPSALYNIGTAYRILGEYRKAVDTYLKVRKLYRSADSNYSPNERRVLDADVEMMLGNVYKEQGQLEEAYRYFFNSLKMDPENLIRMLALHEAASRLNRHEDARIWADMLSTHPNYSPAIARVVEQQNGASQAPNGGEPRREGGKG